MDPEMEARGIYFEETQRFTQWWLWLLLAPVVIGAVYFILASTYVQFIKGVPFGDKPLPDAGLIAADLLFLLTGVGVPLLLWSLRLTVTVDAAKLDVRYWPLSHRTVPIAEIQSWEARDYRPVRDFGGWGIKLSLKDRRLAYNMSGTRGVFVDLINGKKIMIGSQQADDLARALGRAKGCEKVG